jgi:hypothetical protein
MDDNQYNPPQPPNPGPGVPGDQPYQPPANPVPPQPPQPQPAAQPPQPPGQQRPPLKIDNNLLVELGLGELPQPEKTALLKHIYETLEMRVGMRLADQMSNEQLDEFETYFNARDDAGAFRWLETNFPNYKDIVAEEFEKLKAEVGQTAPHILSASQQQALQPQQAPQGYPQAPQGEPPMPPSPPQEEPPQNQPPQPPAY